MGIAAATTGTRLLLWDDCGKDGAADGRGRSDTAVSGVLADCTTTRPRGSGPTPTRQSDALDSEPTTCCCYRGTGCVIGVARFLVM